MALGLDSAFQNLKISIGQDFFLTPVSVSSARHCQDVHFSFPLTLALLSCYCWMNPKVPEESQVWTEGHGSVCQIQDQGEGTSSSMLLSFLLLDLILCTPTSFLLSLLLLP